MKLKEKDNSHEQKDSKKNVERPKLSRFDSRNHNYNPSHDININLHEQYLMALKDPRRI